MKTQVNKNQSKTDITPTNNRCNLEAEQNISDCSFNYIDKKGVNICQKDKASIQKTVHLVEFILSLKSDQELAGKVKRAKTPFEIRFIAKSAGYEICIMQLKYWSAELWSDFYPWSDKTSAWRRNFFGVSCLSCW